MSGVRWKCPWCPLTFPTFQQSRPEGHECEPPAPELGEPVSISEAIRRWVALARARKL